MKDRFFVIITFLLFNTVFAQQNFFNVASSDITEKNKIFFQQQLNVNNAMFQSNSTFDYGLGKNFEIGLNLLGVSFEKNELDHNYRLIKNDQEIPYTPFLMINAQKRVDISEKFAFGLGVQQGITLTEKKFGGGYYFLNGILNDESLGLKCVMGLYYTSNSFVGKGKRLFNQEGVGIQAGLEKKIWKDKLLLQADFISGQHSLGELVMGGAYCLKPNFIVSAGYQIPTFNSISVNSFVFELTFISGK